MKLTPNQLQKIEDICRSVIKAQGFTEKSLLITEQGIRINLSFNAAHTNKYHKNYSFDQTLSINSLNFISAKSALDHNATIADVEKVIRESQWFKDFTENIKFSTNSIKSRITDILKRKPYEDVQSFLSRIIVKIELDTSSLVETTFEQLQEYFKSSEYQLELDKLESQKEKKYRSVEICYDLIDNHEMLYHLDSDEILERFTDTVLDNIKESFDQLSDHKYQLQMTSLNMYSDLQSICVEFDVEQPITYDELEELLLQTWYPDLYFQTKIDTGYFGRYYETFDFEYDVDSVKHT